MVFKKIVKEVELKAPIVTLKGEKSLTIKPLIKGRPTFIFQGDWQASDIRVIQHTIVRNYRQYQQEVRRLAVTKPAVSDQNLETATAKGA